MLAEFCWILAFCRYLVQGRQPNPGCLGSHVSFCCWIFLVVEGSWSFVSQWPSNTAIDGCSATQLDLGVHVPIVATVRKTCLHHCCIGYSCSGSCLPSIAGRTRNNNWHGHYKTRAYRVASVSALMSLERHNVSRLSSESNCPRFDQDHWNPSESSLILRHFERVWDPNRVTWIACLFCVCVV